MSKPQVFDVAIIGAGAAGMMCAAVAGQRGLKVVLIDHARKLAEKIRISGGGRCNFTNLGTTQQQFISGNPNFCRSALSGYTPQNFLALLKKYNIAWHEKHKGQLFCDHSSEDIIQVLRSECEQGRVAWRMGCTVNEIGKDNNQFQLQTSEGTIKAASLVVATGGMAIPQLGASDYGLKIARQFGLKVLEPRPALVPLTFDSAFWKRFSTLAGVSLEADISTGTGKKKPLFHEDVLFTHKGLSGPGILQISSYWEPSTAITLNLQTELDLETELIRKKSGNRQQLLTVLGGMWPKRLAECWLDNQGMAQDIRLADMPDKKIRELAALIHAWQLTPTGTAGYKKAEVMKGGVDTAELDQKTMQAKKMPGLYFIGEVLDVTGWLGGYNFQWAWASGVACGQALQPAACTL